MNRICKPETALDGKESQLRTWLRLTYTRYKISSDRKGSVYGWKFPKTGGPKRFVLLGYIDNEWNFYPFEQEAELVL